MRIRYTSLLALCGALASCVAPSGQAAELKVLSAIGMRQVLLELGPRFERATGHALAITFDSTGVLQKRIAADEPVDVVLLNQNAIDTLAGRRVISSVAPIARSVAAVAIRKGTVRPDISSPEAFRRLLLSAASIARPSPSVGGSSGDHIVTVLNRLGITAEIDAKSVISLIGTGDQHADSPGDLVAKGKAEIALHQLQELQAVAGVEVVGPFPGDLQGNFTFAAAIGTGSTQRDAAQALIAFLQTPQAAAVITAKGMALP